MDWYSWKKKQKLKPEAWFFTGIIRRCCRFELLNQYWGVQIYVPSVTPATWEELQVEPLNIYIAVICSYYFTVHHLNKSRLGRFLLSSVACPVLFVSTEKTLPGQVTVPRRWSVRWQSIRADLSKLL